MVAISIGVEDAQRADDRIVERGTRIRMEGEGQVYRYVESLLIGIGGGTACQVVYPDASALVVVGVVVLAVALGIYAVRHSGPLKPIACCLTETGITASLRYLIVVGFHVVALALQVAGIRAFQVLRRAFGRNAAGNVAHTAADLHSIGRHNASGFVGKVAQGYFAGIAFALGETEGAMSGLAIGIAGALSVILIPILYKLLLIIWG